MVMETQNWSKADALHLKDLHLDPIRNTPDRLKSLVDHFKTPGASVFQVTEGMGPDNVSKTLARKIRTLVREGSLDWVLDQNLTPSSTNNPKLLDELMWQYPVEFACAAEAYKNELEFRIQVVEIVEGNRATVSRGLQESSPWLRPFLFSLMSGQGMTECNRLFDRAIGNVRIKEAREIGSKIGVLLDQALGR